MGEEERMKIAQMGLSSLWNTFKKEADMTSNTFKYVLYGVRIRFNLANYLEGWGIRIKEKDGKIIINNKSYKKENIDIELLLRERLMFEELMNLYKRKGVLEI